MFFGEPEELLKVPERVPDGVTFLSSQKSMTCHMVIMRGFVNYFCGEQALRQSFDKMKSSGRSCDGVIDEESKSRTRLPFFPELSVTT